MTVSSLRLSDSERRQVLSELKEQAEKLTHQQLLDAYESVQVVALEAEMEAANVYPTLPEAPELLVGSHSREEIEQSACKWMLHWFDIKSMLKEHDSKGGIID